jgi:hypothetical protein
MKNYMEKVAEILGVKIGEEFIVKNTKRTVTWDCKKKELVDVNPLDYIVAKLHENGLEIIGGTLRFDNIPCYNIREKVLNGLLTGMYTIEPKPWKPKYKETYWSIGTGGVLEPGTWLNDFVDISLYRLGNCYRTAEEAGADAEKWTKFCESDERIKF